MQKTCFAFIADLTMYEEFVVIGSRHGLRCNFDHGLCDWLQINRDQFDWRQNFGRSPEKTSGPLSDHTGNGSYVYVSGSDSQGPASVAILSSPALYLASPISFSFWYHMNGVGIGNLSLIATDKFGNRKTLWSRHGRQGPDWLRATLRLDSSAEKVEFVASAKYHYNAITAIDDVTVNIEPIEVTPAAAAHTTSGPQQNVSAFASSTTTIYILVNPSEFPDCSFDQSMCMWKQSTSDELDWHRVPGSSPDHTSGPTEDHTSGSGHYLLLMGHETRNSTWAAHLFSPLMSVYDVTKMTFWFHMNGVGIGHLRIIERMTDAMESVIWTRNGRQNHDWLKAEVTLIPGRYQLIFEASARLHYGSDLAVDDITFDPHPGY
ncbi:MAM and LDL-receptor class A domain-containing protein 1-like [Ylistrum balloti]|uniref:MAM and LDL-receptor class A domain-containing protein 1-like n=1 Tax=Ylistrum balloti TaxID=509963 RepID=UPI002905BC5F|nr:MAM and LDL-receptor class A domain-containing protein 1-like [Ylistrum balloti]